MHQESAHTEFFSSQNVADRLVRESGQNTLDASIHGATARLAFRFRTAPAEAFSAYLEALWPHLEAQSELCSSLPATEGEIPILLVEDFGTTGLTGSLEEPDRAAAERNEPAHRLFWFFKNAGRTSKSGDRLGSFGIGKTVFPSSSRINTFFGFSTRKPSPDLPSTILLGQAYLKEHSLTGSGPLDPFGFFAWHEGDGSDYEQRPVSETPQLEEFRRQFGLQRQPDQTGLSVVIPYPDAELDLNALGRAAIEQFFLPILSGKLVCEFHSPAGQTIALSAETILDAVGQFQWGQSDPEPVRKRIELAAWAFGRDERATIYLNRPNDVGQPKFGESMFPSDTRKNLSQRYLRGERLALRIPVPIEPTGRPEVWSSVDVFLEYDPSAGKSDDIYAREGLTLTDHRGLARQAGLRSILLAQDAPVSALLRSSETVSHTMWRRKGASRLSAQYVRGPSKVKYVLDLVPAVVQALLSPEDTADWWTLADLFPEPSESDLPSKPEPRKDNGEPVAGEPTAGPPTGEGAIDLPPIAPGRPRQWLCKPASDGFVIEPNPAFEGSLRDMRLTVAYGLPYRTGFQAHRSYDFSFRNERSMFTAVHAEVAPLEDNVLWIRPKSSSFRVEVSGFDRHRALDYRIVTMEDE